MALTAFGRHSSEVIIKPFFVGKNGYFKPNRYLNRLKQQSTDGIKRAGALRAPQGSRKQPITPSFSFLPGGDPGGCFRLPKHPPGSKKQQTNTHTTINYLRETLERSRRTVRGVTIE